VGAGQFFSPPNLPRQRGRNPDSLPACGEGWGGGGRQFFPPPNLPLNGGGTQACGEWGGGVSNDAHRLPIAEQVLPPNDHLFTRLDAVGVDCRVVACAHLQGATAGDVVLHHEHTRGVALLDEGTLGHKGHIPIGAQADGAPREQARFERQIGWVVEGDAEAQVAGVIGSSGVDGFDFACEAASGEGIDAHLHGHALPNGFEQGFGQCGFEIETAQVHHTRHQCALPRHRADLDEPLGNPAVEGGADEGLLQLLLDIGAVGAGLGECGACRCHLLLAQLNLRFAQQGLPIGFFGLLDRLLGGFDLLASGSLTHQAECLLCLTQLRLCRLVGALLCLVLLLGEGALLIELLGAFEVRLRQLKVGACGGDLLLGLLAFLGACACLKGTQSRLRREQCGARRLNLRIGLLRLDTGSDLRLLQACLRRLHGSLRLTQLHTPIGLVLDGNHLPLLNAVALPHPHLHDSTALLRGDHGIGVAG
jgi:hypothetical protein